MVLRAETQRGNLKIFAYSNDKGKKEVLSVLEYDKPIEELSQDQLRTDIAQLKVDAQQQYAKRLGLQAYTTNGGE